MAQKAFRFVGAETETLFLEGTFTEAASKGYSLKNVAANWKELIDEGFLGGAALREDVVAQYLTGDDDEANWQDLEL